MNIKNNSKGMIISGPLATSAVDSVGEVLDVSGIDISSLLTDGYANYEHLQADDGTRPMGQELVRTIIAAKKIFKESDCENDDQPKYWDELKIPFLWGAVRLFDGSNHPGAVALAAVIRDHVAHNEKINLRFSIEAQTLEREGNILKRTIARGVAVTKRPANKSCRTTLLLDPNAPKSMEFTPPKETKDILDTLVDKVTNKSENINEINTLGSGGEVGVFEDVKHKVLKSLVKLKVVKKAIAAGNYDAAPGTLAGGAALQVEDTSRRKLKDKIKTIIASYEPKSEFVRSEFRSFLKAKLPEVSDDFLDHYAEQAEKWHVPKTMVKNVSSTSKDVQKSNEFNELQNLEVGNDYSLSKLLKNQNIPLTYKVENILIELRKAMANVKQPGVIDVNKHVPKVFQHTPEQTTLVHGADTKNWGVKKPEGAEKGISEKRGLSQWVTAPHGKLALVKRADPKVTEHGLHPAHNPMAETTVHNLAHKVFGTGKYVPTTTTFQHPENGDWHSIQEAVPGAFHLELSDPDENGNERPVGEGAKVLKQLGESGELHKLALQNLVLGNVDRHAGNFMFSRTGPQLHLIDNGYNFLPEGQYEFHHPAYLHAYLLGKGIDPERGQDIPIHPEARKWLQKINPQNLHDEMLQHGWGPQKALEVKKRLIRMQRLAADRPTATFSHYVAHGWHPDTQQAEVKVPSEMSSPKTVVGKKKPAPEPATVPQRKRKAG